MDDVSNAAGEVVRKSVAMAQEPLRELTAWVKARESREPSSGNLLTAARPCRQMVFRKARNS